MDEFIALTRSKLNLRGSDEECLWLQNVFNVVMGSIYSPRLFDQPCDKLCVDIINVLLERNDNILPLDHTVLSVSNLYKMEEGKYFTGTFGERSKITPSQIPEFNILEERPMILLGFLTSIPTSDATLIPERGMLYLEDNKNAIICQIFEETIPSKCLFDRLVLLPRWNFINVKFPVYVFKGDKQRKTAGSNYLRYIEVVEEFASIQKPLSKAVPIALTIEEYFSKREGNPEKENINIVGCLKTLCLSQLTTESKPFFLALFYSLETQQPVTIAFMGERFSPWHDLMKIGETYVISELKESKMNKGQPNERELLVATKHSDFYPVHPCIYMSFKNASTERCKESQGLKRKRDEMETEKENATEKETKTAEGVSRCKPTPPSEPQPVKQFLGKSGYYYCSEPLAYLGTITAIIDSNIGLYEIDNTFRLFTHYLPCRNFGCGMRVGACVKLHYVHMCKLGKKVLGIVCCNSSTITVTKASMLDSPFEYWISGASYIHQIFHLLPLVDLIKALDVCETLSKQFKTILSSTKIIGPRKAWKSVTPTILSHLVDLEAMTSTSSRCEFDEFFNSPHECVVTAATHQFPIPKLMTLRELLDLVDDLRTQEETQGQPGTSRGQYSWEYQEICQDELPDDLVLLGWLSNKNGRLHFTDSTSSVLCHITASTISESLHECHPGCLIKKQTMADPILPATEGIKTTCPLPQTAHFGAILKLTSFKIIVETFNGVEPLNERNPPNPNNSFIKVYLVFSPCDAIIIGKLPSFASETSVKDTFSRQEEMDVSKQVEKSAVAACKFVVLVKSKELAAVRLERSGGAYTLAANVHFYLLDGHITDRRGKNNVVKDGGVISQNVKPFMVLRLLKEHCHWLNMLHEGHVFYIYETEHVNSTCEIADTQTYVYPTMNMFSNIRIEEIDDGVRTRDEYEDWVRMAEPLIRIQSVRFYLSTWENKTSSEKRDSSNLFVSLRGIILTRETIVPDPRHCPFSSVPEDLVFLPHHGLAPSSIPVDLALGSCYLGNRTVVLTVRDVSTDDTMKMYLDFRNRAYPLGLLPGAVVTFYEMEQHISRKGNLYLSFQVFSNIRIDALPSKTNSLSSVTSQQEHSLIESRPIIEYFNFQSCGKIFFTLSYVLCHITAVQKVSLVWTCSRCSRLSNNCNCSAHDTSRKLTCSSQARCLVEDGTGEAMLFLEEDDQVRRILNLRESAWLEIKNAAQPHGEIIYQRPAYWNRNDSTRGESQAQYLLRSATTSPIVYRRVKALCRQFKMEKIQGGDTRNIKVDGKQHTTSVPAKITLNALEINEVDSKKEVKTLFTALTGLS
ncbi:CST complex subunit CTC1-like [Dendronephthya gigantea]|uniref:CST complex subunit CTC1-like n=1 Tax=Dendronephthya gigantea TaxID=151771 RepID=UPI00106A5A29|nr:CST complex subunit CTC1-like [Dendronephthya gigantea]XP_028406898.1 CST complex subunit CTC1-like [Dendronephthya gigantea]